MTHQPGVYVPLRALFLVSFYFILFIQYFNRVMHLAVIAILSCCPLCRHIYIYTNTNIIK